MYEIITSVIQSGRYELTDMLDKIHTIWIQGTITDNQKDELVAAAQKNAKAENSFAPLQTQIDQAFAMIAELRQTMEANAMDMAALKDAVEQLGAAVVVPEPEPDDEWPEYVTPTGAHDAYYKGDQITYNGKHYTCTAPEGTACVWPPDVFPAFWQEET